MHKNAIALTLLAVLAFPALAEERERNIRAAYDALAPLGCGERKEAYRAAPREQQLALWTLHLQRFLAAHPELTGTQRSFVFEGLGMIASGALYREDDPAAKSLVQAFKERGLQQFDRQTFDDAFVKLGGRRDPAVGARRPSRVRTLQPYCDCDGEQDCPGTECDWFHPCTEVIACGPFGMDYCLGVCEW